MSSSILARITAEAKRIRRARPGMKWTNALKEAGKKFRGKRVGATLLLEKGETRRTKPSRVLVVKRKRTAPKKGTFRGYAVGAIRPPGFGGNTLKATIAGVRKGLAEQLGRLEARKFLAARKSDKNRIQKEIATLKRQIKKMS